MKKVYFTVGPSQVYPTLYKHINRALAEDVPSMNHRGEVFKKLFNEASEDLKKLFNVPESYQIFFVSSALESMERTIQGCVEKYSFHVVTGSFGKTWAKYATQLGKKVTKLETKFGEGVGISNLEVSQNAELICLTQNDTSTGIWIPPQDIEALKKKYPNKLLALDLVSSVPFVDINYKFADVTFFSVQKGFGLPPGLAVVIVSPAALEKTRVLIKKGVNVGTYHNFENLSTFAQKGETPETPNILNIYLLNAVVKDMLKIGLSKIRKETEQKSNLLYRFFESHKNFEPFVKDIKFRSPTTLVLDVKGNSQALRKKLSVKGLIVGAGYGDYKDSHIRVGNFPAHSLKEVCQMLKYI